MAQIDVTNLIAALQSTFITWGVNYLFATELATPGMEFTGLPIVSSLDRAMLKYILTKLSNEAVMLAFFTNTAIKKATESQDYLDAVNYKNSLPENASDEEYLNAEISEVNAFVQFTSLVS